MALMHPTLHEDLENVQGWVMKQGSPELRADAAITTMKKLRTFELVLSRIRVQALREMVEAGWSYTDIAAHTGMTRQRVEQLVNS